MELLVFGHGGARTLVFPTSQGRHSDWEEHGLVGGLSEPLEAGYLQLFCVDGIDSESWYATDKPIADRIARHLEYDRYLVNEVIPFTLEQNGTAFLICMGAGFGGYHAVNFACRHPRAVNRLLSMSGPMDIGRFLNGHRDENTYFNNPIEYLANDYEPARLESLRRMDVILAVGRDDGLCESNERLSSILWNKGIWHALRIWDGLAHDWPAWGHMLQLYLGGHD
jgi:esterase/lipase superfamily enzyme